MLFPLQPTVVSKPKVKSAQKPPKSLVGVMRGVCLLKMIFLTYVGRATTI